MEIKSLVYGILIGPSHRVIPKGSLIYEKEAKNISPRKFSQRNSNEKSSSFFNSEMD